MWDLEIKMKVPFDIMVFYPDDDLDKYIIEPSFQKIIDFLNININVPEIIESMYENRNMNSSISVYFADETFKNFVLLDTQLDNTDQLDLIYVCIRCTAEKGGSIRNFAHDFYTKQCKYNIIYAEGNNTIRDLFNVDFSDFNLFNKIDCKKILKDRKINFYQSGILLRTIGIEEI